MKPALPIALILLAILHHDWWWWDTPTLVFGILPVGLAWQVLFSLLAAGLWAAAARWAWPERWEAWADEETDEP